MKYAHIEKDTNKLLGWYDDSIHKTIPTPNIEVQDEVWQEAIDQNTNCYEKGKFIVKDFRTAEDIQNAKISKAKAYLNQTDWYLIREIEEGISVPEDVKAKRAEYKTFIREVENGKIL
jgi:hypothetical protein